MASRKAHLPQLHRPPMAIFGWALNLVWFASTVFELSLGSRQRISIYRPAGFLACSLRATGRSGLEPPKVSHVGKMATLLGIRSLRTSLFSRFARTGKEPYGSEVPPL